LSCFLKWSIGSIILLTANLFSPINEFWGCMGEVSLTKSFRLFFIGNLVIWKTSLLDSRWLKTARPCLIFQTFLTFLSQLLLLISSTVAFRVNSGHRITEIVSLTRVEILALNDLLACSCVDCVRSDSCVVFACRCKMVFSHGQSILCHVGISLNLLLNHIHTLHCVWVYSVLNLRYMPPSEWILPTLF